jgi:hypothetical protein
MASPTQWITYEKGYEQELWSFQGKRNLYGDEGIIIS